MKTFEVTVKFKRKPTRDEIQKILLDHDLAVSKSSLDDKLSSYTFTFVPILPSITAASTISRIKRYVPIELVEKVWDSSIVWTANDF